jgi:hypothetical protein
VWYPRKLERVLAIFRREPEIGVVYHDEYVVRDRQRLHRTRYGPLGEPAYQYLLFRGCRLSTSATVVQKTHLVEAGLFSESLELVTVEDYDLWLRLAQRCPFRFLPEVLGEHRLHGQGESGNLARHIANTFCLIDRHLPTLARNWSPLRTVAARHRLRAGVYFGAGRRLHNWHAGEDSLGYYWRAFCEWPFFWKTYVGLALLAVAKAAGVMPSSEGAR